MCQQRWWWLSWQTVLMWSLVHGHTLLVNFTHESHFTKGYSLTVNKYIVKIEVQPTYNGFKNVHIAIKLHLWRIYWSRLILWMQEDDLNWNVFECTEAARRQQTAISFYQSAFSSKIISEVKHKKSMPFLENVKTNLPTWKCGYKQIMEDKSSHSSNKKLLNWWGKLNKIADIGLIFRQPQKFTNISTVIWVDPFNKNN